MCLSLSMVQVFPPQAGWEEVVGLAPLFTDRARADSPPHPWLGQGRGRSGILSRIEGLSMNTNKDRLNPSHIVSSEIRQTSLTLQ
ncbi:hypothetical protein Q664_02895 [Archangium violaceum Cb vi76]|uniref:Uncharacterized protein n=1 Tax=Archangium violaceum Cb vi76 TaxID=1406225 RepID=A0A084T189_9BACT|nr:hypothetical protein Q664_02895 [Archangium violaceum Cb vi76]